MYGLLPKSRELACVWLTPAQQPASPHRQSVRDLPCVCGLQGVILYELFYAPLDRNLRILDTGEVRVRATFSAAGPNWSTSGFSTYFVFAERDGQWLITDTDFHRRLDADFAAGAFRIAAYIGVPILLIILVLVSRKYVRRRNLLGDRSLWFLLVANGVTILLVVVQSWDLATVLWIYWCQSVTIGIFNFIRMLELGEPKPALFFLVLKAGADAVMHVIEHAILRRGKEQPDVGRVAQGAES